MRGFEMNVHGHVAPVTEQPLAHPEMEMQMSPILRTMLEERMARMVLFQRPQMLQRSDPFDPPMLPPDIQPKFDIGGGGQ